MNCIALLCLTALLIGTLASCQSTEATRPLSTDLGQKPPESTTVPNRPTADTTTDSKENETPDHEISTNDSIVGEDQFTFSKKDHLTELIPDVTITLQDNQSQANGEGVSIEKNTVTITRGGSYLVKGALTDGTLIVNASKEDKLYILFDTVSITSSTGPAFYISSADKVFITLAENSENRLCDGKSYTFTDSDTTPDAALYSREDLTINAQSGGKLTVIGQYKHGIVSKDDLVITSGEISVNAPNVALSGKDSVKIGGGKLTLTAGSDGIRADNTESLDKGFVYLHDGEITVTAGNDGVQAETSLRIDGGKLTVKTGNGAPTSNRGYSGSESKKGLKAGGKIELFGGEIKLDCEDDGIHSNNLFTIEAGSVIIASGDDGIHADETLTLASGSLTVTKSYEGLEAKTITIKEGKHAITASDDGLNASSGRSDGNDFGGGFWSPGGGNGMMGNDPDCSVTISGGYLLVNAAGDGLDSNGDLIVTGGVILVAGPTNSGNGALDYGGTAKVSGGTLIALGASGMAEGFKEGTVGSFLTTFSNQTAGKLFAVTDDDGNLIASFQAPKSYSSAVVVSPKLEKGKTYSITVGGSVEGTDENGFADSGKLSGGSTVKTVTMTSLTVNEGGMSGGPGGGGGRPPRG